MLDITVISEPLRPDPNKAVMQQLESHKQELSLLSIVWHELLLGCFRLPKSKERSVIEKYLHEIALPIFSYDAEAAQWHAAERARLMNIGKTTPFADGQIAAIAHTQSLTLVTSNTSDFKMFKDL